MWSKEELFDNFKQNFQDSAGTPINWRVTDIGELEVETDDGFYIYDEFTKVLRPKIDTSTDIGWRKEFARRLKRKMSVRRMTQTRLSEETGISQVLLSMYSNGKRLPSVLNVSKIAKALGCAAGDLIDF